MIGICDGSSNTIYEGLVNPYTREVFWDDEELEKLQEHLDMLDVLVFHNTQFDMRMLASIGIKIDHLWDKIEDTLLCAHLFASGDAHDLEHVAIRYLDYWDDEAEEVAKETQAARTKAKAQGYRIAEKGMPEMPGAKGNNKWWKADMWLVPETCEEYLISDIQKTWLLWDAFRVQLNKDQLWPVYRLRKRLLKICYDITSTGLHLNEEATEEYLTTIEAKIELIKKYLRDETGVLQKFNWNSKGHLTYLIHKHLKIPIIFTTETGQPSTKQDSIKWYIENYPKKELRALQKGLTLDTKKRYAESYWVWAADGAIHSNLNVTGTRETRQSSSGPNQQNITGPLKLLFEPPQGYFELDADFKNIEMRIWAYSIGNEDLIAEFESGKSVHHIIMETLYPKEYKRFLENPKSFTLARLYRDIKSGNFAMIYGASEKKIDETYGYEGALQKVGKRFPGVPEFTQNLIVQCEKNMVDLGRHCVFTLEGYPIDVPTDEPFKACNYYIQGSAGIIMNKALVAIVENPDYIDSDSALNAQVHDSAKVLIPYHKTAVDTVHSIVRCMEECAIDIFGPTPVDFEIKTNKRESQHNLDLISDLIDEVPF